MKNIPGCLIKIIFLSFSFLFFSSSFYETALAAPVDFPKKEITVVVGAAPAGAWDILARGVGKTMSKYLGVPVVVMNMPGAGSVRAQENVYFSAPDGYTIGINTATAIIDEILEKRNYENKKFTYIGRAQCSPSFLFVKSDSPFHSVKDFKTFGKPVRHSTWSLTSTYTVVSMILAQREGFPLIIVGGYQGAAPTALSLIRGEVEFTGLLLSPAIPFVQAGQIRPILTIDQKRDPYFPNIATVGEEGHPDLGFFALSIWFLGPPGIPKDRVKILEDALMKTLKDPDFLEWAKGAGVDPGPLSGEETTKMVLELFDTLGKFKGEIGKYIKK